MCTLRRSRSRSLLILSVLIGCGGADRTVGIDADETGIAAARVPSAPFDLSATAVSANRIELSWQHSSGQQTGFEIHRSTSGPGGTFTLLASTGADAATHADAGLAPLRQYCYRIRAFGMHGRKRSYSGFSETACATTPGAPAAPSDADATSVSSSAVDVTWADNSGNEDGFRVERSATTSGPWQVVATTGPGARSYRDEGLPTDQPACYRVVAFNAHGDSAPSNVDCATPSPVMAAPTNLTAVTATETNGIDLAWADNSDVETGYQVERSIDGVMFVAIVNLALNSISYRDAGGVGTTITYSYRVRARRNTVFSDYSNVASASGSVLRAPAPPPVFQPSGNFGGIWLQWWNTPGTVDNFTIERCESQVCADADFAVVAVVPTAGADFSSMTYHDYGLQPWIIYTYRLRASNRAGESGPSNQVQGRTCIEDYDWIAPCFPPLPEPLPPAFAPSMSEVRG